MRAITSGDLQVFCFVSALLVIAHITRLLNCINLVTANQRFDISSDIKTKPAICMAGFVLGEYSFVGIPCGISINRRNVNTH